MAHLVGSYESVVAALYMAVADAEQWPEALRELGRWAGGADVCRLTGWDDQASQSPLFVRASETLDNPSLEDHEASYFTHYRPLDPRLPMAARHFAQRIGSCEQHLSKGEVDRGEFFQDFMRKKCDVRWTAGGRVFSEGPVYVDFALERVRQRGDFQVEDVARLHAIEPHLRRALAAHMRLSKAQILRAISSEALDATDHGVIAVDPHSRILLANKRAEAMLRTECYVVAREGRLLSATGLELAGAIARVAANGQPVGVQLMPRSRDALEPACSATLTRISEGSPAQGLPWHRTGGPVVLCALTVHGRQRHASVRQMMDLFGLTAAQSRVARCLLSGSTAEEVATALDVRISTVRTHISVLLRKTQSRNVAALCSLLSNLPSVR